MSESQSGPGEEHTTVKLARALREVPGVPDIMITRAEEGYYHDYLSPLAMPVLALMNDLTILARTPSTPRNSRPLLRQLARRVGAGEFDASEAESDEWARSEDGQETMKLLLNEGKQFKGDGQK